mmetsp:Transcript_106955/g.255250  ORF Transcript_106955/g.255250 Transcript_106955/m.255250 type:complete len:279 (-) Transcript_106955:565-1401(-)
MLLFHLAHRLRWAIQVKDDSIVRHSWVPGNNRIYLLLVDCPNLVPFHHVGGLGHALRKHKVLQALHRHAAAQHTLHGGEAGVIPAIHVAVVHEPRQLPLGEDGVGELGLCKLHHLHFPRAGGFQHPIVHGSSVLVLNGPERVGHALKRVHHGAGEVIGWVCLVLEAVLVVRRVGLAAIEHRVPQALVGILHVHLGTHAHGQALLAAFQHLGKSSQVLFNSLLSALARCAFVPLCPHGVNIGVIHIGLALLDQRLHGYLQLVKVVGGVANLVGLDLQSG